MSPDFTLRLAAHDLEFFTAADVHDAKRMSLEAPAALRESGDARGAPDSVVSCRRQAEVDSPWR